MSCGSPRIIPLLLMLVGGIAYGHDEEEPTNAPMLLFLSPAVSRVVSRPDTVDALDPITRVMMEAISDLPVSARARVVDAPCSAPSARAALLIDAATAVICFAEDDTSRRLFFYMPLDDGEIIQERTFRRDNPETLLLLQTEILRGWVRAMRDILRSLPTSAAEQGRAARGSDANAAPSNAGPEANTPIAVVQAPETAGAVSLSVTSDIEPVARLFLSPYYAFYSYSAAHPVSHGLGLGLGARLSAEWGFLVRYQFHFPVEAASDALLVRLAQHVVHLGGRYGRRFGRTVLFAEASAAMMVADAEIRVREGTLTPPTAEQGRLQVGISTLAGVMLDVSGPLDVFVAIGADVLVRRLRFTYEAEGSAVSLFLGWPVQPTVCGGVSFDFL